MNKSTEYTKAGVTGITASLTDMYLMFILQKRGWGDQTSYIASTCAGMAIQFFGNKYWTFGQNNVTSKRSVKQGFKFITFEIIITIIMSYAFPFIMSGMASIMLLSPHSSIRDLIYSECKHEITPIGSVIIKHVITFIIFNAISYPAWKYIFKE